MKTFAIVMSVAAISLSPVAAQAGGWGGKSGSLIGVGVSPSVGNVNVLNGSAILSGNGILSGNTTGILNGNAVGVLNGSLNGTLNNIGVGVLGKVGGKRR